MATFEHSVIRPSNISAALMKSQLNQLLLKLAEGTFHSIFFFTEIPSVDSLNSRENTQPNLMKTPWDAHGQ